MTVQLDLSNAPWPSFPDDERGAADAVLVSGRVNYWTGDEGRAFEEEFGRAFGVDYAVVLANGSLALDAALIGLGLGPGDEVIVTPRSYFASVSSIILAGAKPVFADVDRDSQNLTAATIEAALSPATRAIMPVHLAGWPCDMAPIVELARARDLKIIEDCAQAHGARYRGRPVGGFGDAAGFSFCQDKIMTTGGEGGMLLTPHKDVWERVWSFKDHGKSLAQVRRQDHPPGFRWLHESIGNNWRMTEMQAAIGRVQLKKLPEWVARRQRNAAIFRDAFSSLAALRTPQPPDHSEHAYYKFYTFVRPDALRAGASRDSIMTELSGMGVPCFSGSCPEIYREKAIVDLGLSPEKPLPVARELGQTSLMFLVHPTLTESQVNEMASRAVDVVRAATR